MDKGIIVKNLHGTTDNKPPERVSSWLQFYRKMSGRRISVCQAKGCTRDDLKGAHVKKAHGNAKNDWYIIPLCTKHNNMVDEEFELKPCAKLVSVTK